MTAGFAAFTVDPGRHPGDTTSLLVTYYNVNKPSGALSVFEAIEPVDVVGLSGPGRRNWHPFDPGPVLASAWKLGVNRGAVADGDGQPPPIAAPLIAAIQTAPL